MKGLDEGKMLIAGRQQWHQDDIALNLDTGEKVGTGIYLTPHFQIALDYAMPLKIQ